MLRVLKYLEWSILQVDLRLLQSQCQTVATSCGQPELSDEIFDVAISAVKLQYVSSPRSREAWTCILHAIQTTPKFAGLTLEWRQFFAAIAMNIVWLYRMYPADLILQSIVELAYQMDDESIDYCTQAIREIASEEKPILGPLSEQWAAVAVLEARGCASKLARVSGQLARHFDEGASSMSSGMVYVDIKYWRDLWIDVTLQESGLVRLLSHIRNQLDQVSDD